MTPDWSVERLGRECSLIILCIYFKNTTRVCKMFENSFIVCIPCRKRNEIDSAKKTAQGLQIWLASDYKLSLILSNLAECLATRVVIHI